MVRIVAELPIRPSCTIEPSAEPCRLIFQWWDNILTPPWEIGPSSFPISNKIKIKIKKYFFIFYLFYWKSENPSDRFPRRCQDIIPPLALRRQGSAPNSMVQRIIKRSTSTILTMPWTLEFDGFRCARRARARIIFFQDLPNGPIRTPTPSIGIFLETFQLERSAAIEYGAEIARAASNFNGVLMVG